MNVLGIETTCDETAAAIVDDQRQILAERVWSQIDEHAVYGGVVPEIAARAHVERLDVLIRACLEDAGLAAKDMDAIAVAAGPGLIGGLASGIAMAKGIAVAANTDFLAINHLEGHALTARLTDDVEFPYLLLLASGGHCQILVCHGVGQYQRLGTTLDDALGEAYDKIAKMMGLGYPGGPNVEARAKLGDPKRFDLPRSLVGRPGCHFSFSGLKAAVRRTLLSLEKSSPELSQGDINDVCASFEAAVGDIVRDRLQRALRQCEDLGLTALVVAGGVAANHGLRVIVTACAHDAGLKVAVPPLRYCGDNAVMIAWAGIERLKLGLIDDLDAKPRPRWPLDPEAEPAIGKPKVGAGVKA